MLRKIKLRRRKIRYRRKIPLRLLLASKITVIIPLLIISIAVFIPILIFIYSRQLPHPDKIVRREGFSTVILDRDEKPLYDIYSQENRIPVKLSQVPQSLRQATIAIEDKDFYRHKGFDPKGMLRAIINIITFQGLQGGSTLTQQLVKNVLLSSERTVPRKIKEFILAVQIENKYDKDEILQMYLNEAPYGGTMWGIQAAAQGYFGKDVSELNMLESAILAGFPQRPSYYSPFGLNPEAYIDRTKEVFRRMREDGYITQVDEVELGRQLRDVEFADSGTILKAPHFVMYVRKQLVERFGEDVIETGGLRVTTTLDIDLQEAVEEIVVEELDKLEGLNVGNGAALVLNPENGEILAYVGSKDYQVDEDNLQGKFDVVSMGYRQPGSALKPITYAVAFTKGYTPSSLIMDVETHFPGGAHGADDYVPRNYDGKYRGPVQLRFALGNSINIPAVKITALVGVKNILKTSYEMGIETLKPTNENVNKLGLSITLGGGEVRLFDLTEAFGVFASGGVLYQPYAIKKVEDKNGKLLFQNKKISGKKVLSKEVSFLISHILLDNNARKDVFGTRSHLIVPGKTVSVKTGTTDDIRDNWTVGYTPSIVVGVWVGNNDNSPMNSRLASGITGAAPIWNRIMRQVLKNLPDETPKKPDNVIAVKIDAFGGGLPYLDNPTRTEYFIKGTEPTSTAPIYRKLKISKSDSNKLASSIDILTGNYEEKEFIVFQEQDPLSTDKNRWQEGIDKWLESQDDQKYRPPTEISNGDDKQIIVEIKKPDNDSKFESDSVEIEAEAKGIRSIEKLELYIDDKLKTTVDGDKLSENVKLDKGKYKIRVRAYDSDNNREEKEINIEIIEKKKEPTSTPKPSITPTIKPSPTVSPTP